MPFSPVERLRCTLNGFTDVFKPAYYFLEYKVASKQIPNVSKIANRKKLKDYIQTESNNNNNDDDESTKNSIFDHSKWDAVLKRHVSVGTGTIDDVTDINLVNYDAIANDEDFNSYLELLEKTNPDVELSPLEQLAFWMNAYNALCINIILQYEKKNSPKINSINDLTITKDNPVWDQVAGKINGKDISLNTIEHDKLRKEWDEPMVHACIVCASASCPNLRPEAFVSDKIEEQMIDQTKNWLQNESKGLWSKNNNKLVLSRIFLWFTEDFGNNIQQNFLPNYLDESDAKKKLLKGKKSAVRYFPYNWKINRG